MTKKETGLFSKLKGGLKKTRESFSDKISDIFSRKKIDTEALEEILISSDIGINTSMDLIKIISKKIKNSEQVNKVIQKEIIAILNKKNAPKKNTENKPYVIMVIGVNGVGKTSTVGKLAKQYKDKNNKVLIIAADTFRAAAVEQLDIWATRAKVDIIKKKTGADPSSVVFDGIKASIARNVDIVLIDTAGRLHNKENLMEELKKIKRTANKNLDYAPNETLLVLDATTGQNALNQAKTFNDKIGVSNIAITKLDGTAKGGIVINISKNLNIPISYIGVGEQIEDLQDFDAENFAKALF